MAALVAMVALTAILTVINIVLALRNLSKEWSQRRRPTPPHPLEAAVRDVARAIRDRS